MNVRELKQALDKFDEELEVICTVNSDCDILEEQDVYVTKCAKGKGGLMVWYSSMGDTYPTKDYLYIGF